MTRADPEEGSVMRRVDEDEGSIMGGLRPSDTAASIMHKVEDDVESVM